MHPTIRPYAHSPPARPGTGDWPRTSLTALPCSFDHDLRLIVSAGEALAANGYSYDLAGMVICATRSRSSRMDLLDGPYRAGKATDFTSASPIGGRLNRTRARPMFNPDGEVIGGLSVMEDVTVDHTRATQLS